MLRVVSSGKHLTGSILEADCAWPPNIARPPLREVSSWQEVFKEAPGRSSAVNIALGYCSVNRYDEAKAYVKRVLEFNPDYAVGRTLLDRLSANPPDSALSR